MVSVFRWLVPLAPAEVTCHSYWLQLTTAMKLCTAMYGCVWLCNAMAAHCLCPPSWQWRDQLTKSWWLLVRLHGTGESSPILLMSPGVRTPSVVCFPVQNMSGARIGGTEWNWVMCVNWTAGSVRTAWDLSGANLDMDKVLTAEVSWHEASDRDRQ